MTDKVAAEQTMAREDDEPPEISMAWAKPAFSKSEVDAAGETILIPEPFFVDDPADSADEDEIVQEIQRQEWYSWYIANREALDVVNNWRSSHSFPLNTFQVGLRRRGRQITPHCLVAQRVKRLSSIEAKLRRFSTMKLSQMQDLGGCRAIVRNVNEVIALVKLQVESNMRHELYDIDDYIVEPPKSGYRGMHLKYRYMSDRQETYNGLRIEIQIRSQLQHAWATAVETVGTFIKQALKSSQGEADWLRFFALMGSALALREKTPLVAGTPTSPTLLRRELREMAKKLNVVSRLSTYGTAIDTIVRREKDAHYYLLRLDPENNQVSVTGYKIGELAKASVEYLEVERSISKANLADAVLVSVDSVDALRRAYPNYFLDTKLFIQALNRALSKKAA